MPGTISNTPTVAFSFANNFWGKDDAGVEPLLQRMHNAKQTCDELKSFYSTRAAIEEEFGRRLLSLSKKLLGSQESGTLRSSFDVVRSEVEQMGKSHQNIANQIKTELEEPLAAFAGAMKERRKIVQTGVEKLHKVKIQQTNQVNKTRDRYEQECLKIKGYLAQGHMVMGQEERKNKAKLEKTQIHLAASNTEYENAVKALEDTTGRWNRDWKAAADKFQDLEEERLDFTKSSLWSFANISSTVCVSDDASCEKIRLSLEKCEVEKDIAIFIKEYGTGQEIPDPPKYINFCRGDASDSQSEISEEDHYSVAQFQRTINPAFRSSSPQPSTYESHHNPSQTNLVIDLDHETTLPGYLEKSNSPQTARPNHFRQTKMEDSLDLRESSVDFQTRSPKQQQYIEQKTQQIRGSQTERQEMKPNRSPIEQHIREQQPVEYETHYAKQPHLEKINHLNQRAQYEYQSHPKPCPNSHHEAGNSIPHDPYPMDGMTMLCRIGPTSEKSPARSSATSSSSRDPQSDVTPFSSQEAVNSKTFSTKESKTSLQNPVSKKKTGFFQNHGPFRRRSNKGDNNSRIMTPSNRNTWSSRTSTNTQDTTTKSQQLFFPSQNTQDTNRPTQSPDLIDPLANLQLNVGNNIFDVETPKKSGKISQTFENQKSEGLDPIAQALAELKGVTKASTNRVSADKYHGIATPAPHTTPRSKHASPQISNNTTPAAQQGVPPPSYDLPVQRLSLPQPAFTSKSMQQTKHKYATQTQNIFKAKVSPEPRAAQGTNINPRFNTRGKDIPRALSPAPPRTSSPHPDMRVGAEKTYHTPSSSPFPENPQNYQPNRQNTRKSEVAYYLQNTPSSMRTASPSVFRELDRSPNQNNTKNMSMQIQLAPSIDEYYESDRVIHSRGRGSVSPGPPTRYVNAGNQELSTRQRSKSVADVRQYNCQGRPILHFARALYMYQAAIPQELSFAKGDIFAVLRHQDDGWWEAEIAGKNERPGLVPSNYVQIC